MSACIKPIFAAMVKPGVPDGAGELKSAHCFSSEICRRGKCLLFIWLL